MNRHWVMRTAAVDKDFLWDELRAGRLRQGWGYKPDLDLRTLARVVQRGDRLNDEQRACWRGNRRMLQSEPGSIQIGDVIVVPNLPRRDLPQKPQDFGHLIPVELLSVARPVDPLEEAVSARLRGTMRSQSRLWNIDYLSEDVTQVVSALSQPARRPKLLERLENIRNDAAKTLKDSLVFHFRGAEFEPPCGALLEALYGTPNVEHTGGPKEKGADFICTSTDPLGVEHKVAVQVKHWHGSADLAQPLGQIRRAFDGYNIAAGVIFTLLDEERAEDAEARVALEKELGIPVRVVLRDEALDLFLEHLPGLIELRHLSRPALREAHKGASTDSRLARQLGG